MKLTVFFDGACYLCSAEIAHYRRIDPRGDLKFVDISQPGFEARAQGLDPVQVNRHLHVRTAQGELHVGIEAFIAIWRVLPRYRTLAALARLPGIHFALKTGYAGFAQVRPYLPRRAHCADGVCLR